MKKAMLFQPGEIDVPEGLQYAETVVILKLSVNNYYKIPVVNDSNKGVMLHQNTQLGELESIKSIVPLQVEEREKSVVNTIILNEADKPIDKQTSKHKEKMGEAEGKDNLPLAEKQHSIINKIDWIDTQTKRTSQAVNERRNLSFLS